MGEQRRERKGGGKREGKELEQTSVRGMATSDGKQKAREFETCDANNNPAEQNWIKDKQQQQLEHKKQ